MKQQITIKNPWPFDHKHENNTIRVEEIVLKPPTILARQEYEGLKGTSTAQCIAMLKRMVVNHPPSIFDNPQFSYPLFTIIMHRYKEAFVDAPVFKKLGKDIRNHKRVEQPKKKRHDLRVPFKADGHLVDILWIHPPPLSSYDKQTERPTCFWAPGFFATFVKAEINGQEVELSGDRFLDMSYQDMEEILMKLDFFLPPDVVASLVSETALPTSLTGPSSGSVA